MSEKHGQWTGLLQFKTPLSRSEYERLTEAYQKAYDQGWESGREDGLARNRELVNEAVAMAEYRRVQLARLQEESPRPTLGYMAEEITRWQAKTFPEGSKDGALNHLQREVREVCTASRGELGEELADCFFLWCQLVTRHHLAPSSFMRTRHRFGRLQEIVGVRLDIASHTIYRELDNILCQILATAASWLEVDLVAELVKKLAINKARKWKEPDEHGVVEHQKDD